MDDALQQRARAIELLLLDVDGVLTDGRLYYSDRGNEIKAFHILDGFGIKLLQHHGVAVGIVTGRQTSPVERRAHELGIRYLHQGIGNKNVAADAILDETGLTPSQMAFMGDDWPDLPVMQRAGLALTVPNAHPAVLGRAHWVSERPGGHGAVREACDLLLSARGVLDTALNDYAPR